jgi:hypothetical protein
VLARIEKSVQPGSVTGFRENGGTPRQARSGVGVIKALLDFRGGRTLPIAALFEVVQVRSRAEKPQRVDVTRQSSGNE